MDENHKSSKEEVVKKAKKFRKGSDNKVQKKFELLMNTGGDLELEMRLMDSKLRKINKECTKKKKFVLKSILKSHDVTRKKHKKD